MSAAPASRPRVAVFKLASCDGCQVVFLNLEERLLALAGRVEIAHFLEASSQVQPGPYDVSFVEGSVTSARDVERLLAIDSGRRSPARNLADAVGGDPSGRSATCRAS